MTTRFSDGIISKAYIHCRDYMFLLFSGFGYRWLAALMQKDENPVWAVPIKIADAIMSVNLRVPCRICDDPVVCRFYNLCLPFDGVGKSVRKGSAMKILLLRTIAVGLVMLSASLGLLQCSFMPEALEAFYALPLPDVSQRVHQAGNKRITYAQTGNPGGRPVVFIHGSPGSWEDWKLVMSRPRMQRRFNMLAVDRPGWSRDQELSAVVPELNQQSRFLRSILDGIDSKEKAILVGHSLGGPIAVRMAVDYPQKVAAIVLLAPSLDPELDAVRWYNRLADSILVQFFLPEMLVRSNAEILALPQGLRELAEEMGMIRMPVVAVHGLKDELVDPGNTDFARSTLANAVYDETLLPNFGHLIPQLRPAEVVLAIETAEDLVNS